MEITQTALAPPQPEPQFATEEQPEEAVSVPPVAEPAVSGVPPSSMTSSFRFIQDSEIETPSFEEGAEWIEKSDAVDHEEPYTNGHAAEASEEVGAEACVVVNNGIQINV